MKSGPTGSVIDSRRMRSISLFCGGIERPSEYLVDRLQLAGMTRSPERRSRALVEEPTPSQVDDPLAVTLSGEFIETSDGGEVLRIARWLEFRVGPTKIVAVKMRVLAQPAR